MKVEGSAKRADRAEKLQEQHKQHSEEQYALVGAAP